MKFVVLCDKKPETCESCYFFKEGFKAGKKPREIEIEKYCVLSGSTIDVVECPLNCKDIEFKDSVELVQIDTGDD